MKVIGVILLSAVFSLSCVNFVKAMEKEETEDFYFTERIKQIGVSKMATKMVRVVNKIKKNKGKLMWTGGALFVLILAVVGGKKVIDLLKSAAPKLTDVSREAGEIVCCEDSFLKACKDAEKFIRHMKSACLFSKEYFCEKVLSCYKSLVALVDKTWEDCDFCIAPSGESFSNFFLRRKLCEYNDWLVDCDCESVLYGS